MSVLNLVRGRQPAGPSLRAWALSVINDLELCTPAPCALVIFVDSSAAADLACRLGRSRGFESMRTMTFDALRARTYQSSRSRMPVRQFPEQTLYCLAAAALLRCTNVRIAHVAHVEKSRRISRSPLRFRARDVPRLTPATCQREVGEHEVLALAGVRCG
jgi:hypothetical protein